MPSVGFEPAIPPIKRQQTHALDRTSIGIGQTSVFTYMFSSCPTRCTLYSLFLPSIALYVSRAICTHHQEHNCSVQIAPETGRANEERNKEYSVHLVGPELNICYQDVRNREHQILCLHNSLSQIICSQ
jgi:hypothetical protein